MPAKTRVEDLPAPSNRPSGRNARTPKTADMSKKEASAPRARDSMAWGGGLPQGIEVHRCPPWQVDLSGQRHLCLGGLE